eukprot:CAMPEP_0196761164 /NCGR_PEP_ID=MMETSP1095-20130614/314_1 /TAXON_ID=96789 ORGANISM="Chromulina nebulosa, Strain UTEXLB2642" /NCGR_SAMPLE_ID=MMETSP1095 /ASSEMBLY_ACC=CAM_ASM_000446 /LENGTH=358 /DNA_ID=CAMNT_0042110347 /DNA_START=146 /DNA_END=1222 /DNA_ORIENTATION=-
MTVLGGTANQELTKQVCDILGVKPGEMDVTRFSDGEIHVQINESIRGKDCFIIQTCAAPVNDNLLELLLTITAARRSGAASVTAVIPYYGYKHNRRGLPISSTYHSRFLWSAASDFAKMLRILGVDKVISVDLQKSGQGHESCFFDNTIPVENISSIDSFVDYINNQLLIDPTNNKKKQITNKLVIVSPNTEYIKKAKKLELLLKQSHSNRHIDTAVILDNTHTNRLEGNAEIVGDVKDADVIIVDDFIDTATSLAILCRLLKKEGARRVFICASHGLFTQTSMELIDLSPVEKVIVTDSVPLPKGSSNKIVQISIAPLIAKILESEAITSNAIWDSERISDDNVKEIDEDDEEFELE